MLHYILFAFISLVTSFFLTKLVIKFALLYGLFVKPRPDRWHKTRTALFGGFSIYFSILITLILARYIYNINFNLSLVATFTFFFLLGLIDDFFELNSKLKFISQLLIGVFYIYFSNSSIIIFNSTAINDFISLFWILLIMNSSNLLDNMDGLLTGTLIIVTFFLGISFNFTSNPSLSLFSFIICASLVSFLYFNFKPAKIFMGDCGSLPLGFLIAALTINLVNNKLNQNQIWYNLLPIFMTAPLLLDVFLVMIRRSISGRKIYIGGKDHISHRLVFLGLNEITAVTFIYLVTFSWNILSIFVLFHFNISFIFLYLFFLFFCTLFLGYILSNLSLYNNEEELFAYKSARGISPSFKKPFFLSRLILNKKIILINLFDSITYIFVLFLLFQVFTIKIYHNLFIYYFIIKLIISNLFKFHKTSWRLTSTHDILKIAIVQLISAVIFYFINYGHNYQIDFYIWDIIISFNLLVFSRISFKLINEFFSRFRRHRKHIVIYGAGDFGVILSKELFKNTKYNMFPFYFIDDDILKKDTYINSIKVLHTDSSKLSKSLSKNNIDTLIVSSLKIDDMKIDKLKILLKNNNIKFLRFDFNISEVI